MTTSDSVKPKSVDEGALKHRPGSDRRTGIGILGAAAAFALLALFPRPVAADHTPPVDHAFTSFFGGYRFSSLDGTVRSGLRIFASGRISIYTRFTNHQPSAIWTMQIYDRGTCGQPSHLIASLGSLTIGSTSGLADTSAGRTVFLSAAERGALNEALDRRRRIVLRLSSGAFVTCQEYREVPPSALEPSA